MQLYHLLSDRASVNILKVLHTNEFVEKASHTMRAEELKGKIIVKMGGSTIPNLSEAGLITTETTDTGIILSITQKGKEFVEQFDKLNNVLIQKKHEQKCIQVQYNLTQLEKKILSITSKIKLETGEPASIIAITEEIYPDKDPESRMHIIERSANKLQGLNLLHKLDETKDEDRVIFDTTEVGERVIKEQFLDVIAEKHIEN